MVYAATNDTTMKCECVNAAIPPGVRRKIPSVVWVTVVLIRMVTTMGDAFPMLARTPARKDTAATNKPHLNAWNAVPASIRRGVPILPVRCAAKDTLVPCICLENMDFAFLDRADHRSSGFVGDLT